MNVLFVGDIVGNPGIGMVTNFLRSFVEKHKIDFVVANGENAADGKGITEKIAQKFFGAGINVITSGNHIWDKFQIHEYMMQEKNLLRPLNFPRGSYGFGYVIYELGQKGKIGVLNLQGRTFMYPIDCPFRTSDWALEKIKAETNIVIVDMHAEATAEKVAMGWYLDGKVSAVIGTHSHVQTADERILPGGTAYITDVGMTGPYDSVIGMKKENALKRFVYVTPSRYEAAENEAKFAAVVITLDKSTGKAVSIERILYPPFEQTLNPKS
ncbi:MAG: TIGR00282 family metallophosphoesterase [Bacteroidetes bacterium]|nr:TIGR00282 family metallophosphoesterase [Bacteroidota bacterium]MCL5737315.1 TIGR00282 family metallophosphoesterase [Bacteroidota bacterium]